MDDDLLEIPRWILNPQLELPMAESNVPSKEQTLPQRLRTLRVTLKSGEYDGADIMRAWCAMDQAADEIERLRGRMDHGTRQVAAIITWLEANQPDLFKRGLWDAIPKDPSFAHETNP